MAKIRVGNISNGSTSVGRTNNSRTRYPGGYWSTVGSVTIWIKIVDGVPRDTYDKRGRGPTPPLEGRQEDVIWMGLKHQGHWSFAPNHVAPNHVAPIDIGVSDDFSLIFNDLELSSDSLSSGSLDSDEFPLKETHPRKRKSSESFENSPPKSPTFMESRTSSAHVPALPSSVHVPALPSSDSASASASDSASASASAHVPASPSSDSVSASASAHVPASPSSAPGTPPGTPIDRTQSSPSSRTPSAMDVACKFPSAIDVVVKKVKMLGDMRSLVAITELCAIRCKKVAELANQNMVDMGDGFLSEAPLNTSLDEIMHEIEGVKAVLDITQKFIS